VRYQSRTGYHNMYKEYRDTTLNGAVSQLYQEMNGRHRVRYPCIQIIKTATVPAKFCKRANTQQVSALVPSAGTNGWSELDRERGICDVMLQTFPASQRHCT
jgi:ribosomal protein L20A (L18A)